MGQEEKKAGLASWPSKREEVFNLFCKSFLCATKCQQVGVGYNGDVYGRQTFGEKKDNGLSNPTLLCSFRTRTNSARSMWPKNGDIMVHLS